MDATFQQHYQQVVDTLNTLAGYNGEIVLNDHLNMDGKNVKNIGKPLSQNDAISSLIANSRYSVEALAPQLESGEKQSLKSYRQMNNPTQREQNSSYLTDLMSTPPSANTIYPTITNVSGGVQVSIPSSLFTFADNSKVFLIGRTDLLALPAQYAISAISCVGNLVSVTAAPTGLAAGQVGTITGVTPADFNGTFTMITSSGGGANLQYQKDLGTVSGAGGFVQVNGCYYYAVKKRTNFISLLGPFSGDTLQNRLQANFDGFSIVAVVVLTNTGGQVEQSGGGGSPIVGSPTAGSFF